LISVFLIKIGGGDVHVSASESALFRLRKNVPARSVFFLQVFRERGFTGTAATAGAGNFRIADFVNFFSHPKSKVKQCAEHEYGGKNNVEHGEKGDG